MAPNRKSSTLFTSNYELESLKIPLQAKFLPLTDPREALQQYEQQQEHVEQELKPDPKTEKPAPTASYWNWPSDTAEDEKVAAVDDLFSTSRFESNLIADSIRRREDSILQIPVTTNEGQTEYVDGIKSYWDWKNEDVDDVEPEVDSSDIKGIPASEGRHCEDCCDDYWAWSPDEVTEDECFTSPSHRLHSMMAESRKKFVRRHSHLPEPEPGSHETVASDHYWHWSEFRSISAQ